MGNFAPYARPIFGFIWVSMPYDAPQTLTPDQSYALTAGFWRNTALSVRTIAWMRLRSREW